MSNSDGLIKWESPFGEYKVTFKNHFYARKTSHVSLPLNKLYREVANWHPWAFERGIVGVYTTLLVIEPDGKKYLWPCIDVEHPQHHDSRADNIRVAQNLFLTLAEAGLVSDLQIILTGRGFRFCWPYLIPPGLIRAFKEFCNDQDCIDTATLKPSKFTRHLAYFGNEDKRRQHQNPYDAHTHLLSKSKYILALDNDLYVDIIAGGLAHDKAADWLSTILPSKPLPAAWFDALQPYADEIKLRNAIIKFPRLPASSGAGAGNLKQALAECDRQGITYTADETSFGTIYRLSECPACHRKDANPYITEAGRLKHWTTSCPAGEDRTDDDRPVGLPAAEWIPDFVEVYEAPEADQDDSGETLTIQDSQGLIETAILSVHDCIIKNDPGGGKTHTTRKTIASFCYERSVVMAFPTREKAKEEYNEALKDPEFRGIRVSLIQGRTSGTEAEGFQDQNCIQADRCAEVAERGYKPAWVVCYKCIQNKDKSCLYWQQFDEIPLSGLSIMTHQKALYLPKGQVDDLIFDENPTDSILQSGSVRIGEILRFKSGTGPDAKSAFDKLQAVLENGLELLEKTKGNYLAVYSEQPPKKDAETIWDAGKITAEERDALARHIAVWQQWEGEKQGPYQRRLYRNNVNLKALTWLLIAVGEQPGIASLEVHRTWTNDPFRFSYQTKTIPNVKGRMIILDGTAYAPAYRKIFGRDFREINASLPMPGCHFVWIKTQLGKRRCEYIKDEKISYFLSHAKEHIKPNDEQILFCTHKNIEDRLKAEAGKVFGGGFQLDTIHFKGSRGINKFKNHDAFICFSSYANNPFEAWKQSSVLFENENDRAEYVSHLNNAENIQCLHRVRPVLSPKTIILIGREWFKGLPEPNVILDFRRGGAVNVYGGDNTNLIEQAYDRVKPFVETFGFLTKDMAWSLGIYSSREKNSAESYHRNWQKIIRINPLFLSDPFLLKYNLVGKGHLNSGVSKIQFEKNSYWNQIIKSINRDFPEIGALETKQVPSAKWTSGAGTLDAVRQFSERFNGHFQPDLWQQITPGRIPETSIFSKSKIKTEMRINDEQSTQDQRLELETLPTKHFARLSVHPLEHDKYGDPRPDGSSEKRIPLDRTPQQAISDSRRRKAEVEACT